MEVYIAEIRPMVEDSYAHEQISEFLQQQNYEAHGFSARSVRRFCSVHNIHYHSNLSVQELDRVVHSGVIAVGHSYGRRTMHGLLASSGVCYLKKKVHYQLNALPVVECYLFQIHVSEHRIC